MSDPNIEPVKLTDFDLLTLSEVAIMSSCQIQRLTDHRDHACSEQRFFEIEREIDRMRIFNTQVLNAFSRVKSEQTVTNN